MPGQRRWVKLWVSECLNGSIRYQLEPDERSVWYDLILFSALGNPPGNICDRDGRAFPHSFIANRLNITEALLDSAINNCIAEGRLTEDQSGVHVTNWDRYQSEYERQKPYREEKKKLLPPHKAQPPKSVESKKEYAEGVMLKLAEHDKLVKQFGEAGANERIAALSLGIKSKGYKYKSHYHTILNWERMKKERGGQSEANQGHTQSDEADLARRRRESIGKPLR